MVAYMYICVESGININYGNGIVVACTQQDAVGAIDDDDDGDVGDDVVP